MLKSSERPSEDTMGGELDNANLFSLYVVD